MNDKKNKKIFISNIIGIVGLILFNIGMFLSFINFYYLMKEEDKLVTKKYNPELIDTNIIVDINIMSYINIPTYNQRLSGYRLGCEGVSLYMALQGLGYMNNYTLDQFMKTMPYANTPFDGYSGNPTIGHEGSNLGKRTTIYPHPLSKWAGIFASSIDLTGSSIDKLKEELTNGHILLVFVTTNWDKPVWKYYPWSINSKGEIENNHCLCVVGYNSNGDFLVNDCHDSRNGGNSGEYWVDGKLFASIYNERKYAIAVY